MKGYVPSSRVVSRTKNSRDARAGSMLTALRRCLERGVTAAAVPLRRKTRPESSACFGGAASIAGAVKVTYSANLLGFLCAVAFVPCRSRPQPPRRRPGMNAAGWLRSRARPEFWKRSIESQSMRQSMRPGRARLLLQHQLKRQHHPSSMHRLSTWIVMKLRGCERRSLRRRR